MVVVAFYHCNRVVVRIERVHVKWLDHLRHAVNQVGQKRTFPSMSPEVWIAEAS